MKESDAEQAGDYLAAAEKDLAAKKAELDQAKKDLAAAQHAEPKKEEPVKPAPSEDAAIEALQNKVADLEKEVAELEKLVADNENNPDAFDYVTAAKEKLEAKKAELEKAEAELEEALKGLEPKDNKSEIKRLEDLVKQLEEQLKDAEENGAESYMVEGLKTNLEEAKKELAELKEAWLNNVTNVPELKVTRYVDADNHDISEAAVGTLKAKDIAGYEFVNTTVQDGITTHIYKVKLPQPAGNTGAPAGGQATAPAGGQAAAPAGGQATAPAEGQAAAPTEGQEAKDEKVLPNTGMNTSNTTALGLSLIGLIGLAVRRKLSK